MRTHSSRTAKTTRGCIATGIRLPLAALVCLSALWVSGCTDSDKEPGCVYTEAECRELATALAPEWGSPVAVDYEAGRYAFVFETPVDELPLLGERTVWVTCETGEATIPLRL